MSLRSKALKLGATDLQPSKRKFKKYVVTYNNKKIHFGDTRYEDYTIHKDPVRRSRYRARHKMIHLKDGTPAYKDKSKPSYWSWHILW